MVDHAGIGGAALIVTLADVRVGCRGAGAVAVGVHIEPEPAAARGDAAAQLVVDRLFAFGGDFEEERVGEFLLQDEGVAGYVFFCAVSRTQAHSARADMFREARTEPLGGAAGCGGSFGRRGGCRRGGTGTSGARDLPAPRRS